VYLPAVFDNSGTMPVALPPYVVVAPNVTTLTIYAAATVTGWTYSGVTTTAVRLD
jgi:hypothetical protein